MPKLPYVAVADALRVRLDEGAWLPGEALPSLRQLAVEFEVSPSTVAKAVRTLASEGRLVILPSYGVFVPDQPT